MSDMNKLLSYLEGHGREQSLSETSMTLEEQRKQDDIIIKQMADATGVTYSDEQLDILKHRGGMCILACAGSGKALKNGTGVLTPNGYVPIEELKVGDICYDVNGEEQEVLGVFPQGKKEIYNVKFSDRSVIPCCSDHLWTYQTYNMRRTTKKWKTDTLEYILNNVPISVYPHTNKKGETQNRANIYIPMAKAIQFSKKELPIKPYLMGALLGDGGLKSSAVNCSYSFTNDDEDIVNRVNSELMAVDAYLSFSKDHYNIVVGSGYGHNNTEGLFTIILKELGLKDTGSHNKFIPEIYKLSSIEDRLEILKGLIDTDGHCKGSSYEITLASERLIDDIKFIAESLGMTAVKSDKIAVCLNPVYNKETEVYRLYIKTSDDIPKIHWSERREKQWKKGQSSARRTIVEIEKTGKYSEMTCIQVSGQSELFITENCIVTHNTTVLTHLIAKRILSGEIKNPDTLMCTTYSKAGATEMEERLNSLFKTLGIRSTVQVKTLHALYLAILRHVNYPTDVISGGTRLRYIIEACKDAKYKLEDEDLQQIDTLLSYQINNLLSDSALVKSYVFTLDNMREEQYTAIRTGYNKRKMENGQIDFDDMQLYVYSLLIGQSGSQLVDFCNHMWTDYYIDEAQDVSKIQFEILRRIIKKDENLVFIGDDDQSIYQWRGADPSIILNIGGYYDIKRFILSTNYRCYSEIVNHAAVGIANNNRRYKKTMKPHVDGGKVRICDTGGGSLFDITKYAYQHIKNLVESGVDPSKIAVLSRNNQHLSLLNNMLYRAGIYCDSSPEMRMTRSAMYRDIKNVMDMATNGYNHNITKSTLWRICTFLGTNNAYSISNIQYNAALSLKDTIGYIFKTCDRHQRIDWDKELNIPSKTRLQVQDLWYRLKNDTIESLRLVYEVLDLDDDKDKVTGLLDLYLMNSSFMYKTEDRSRAINGLVDYTLELINTVGVDNTKTIYRVTEQYEEGKMAVPGSKVTMSTMHGAKGREWEHVVLFADDNVSFPSFDGIKSMGEKGVSVADISASIDENRRLHYVAMTRAKSDLTIFTNLNNISVYLAEALGAFKGTTNNVRIINMANNGRLETDIKEEVHRLYNDKELGYKYEVDITNLENGYKMEDVQLNQQTNENTININSLGVGQFETFGDD